MATDRAKSQRQSRLMKLNSISLAEATCCVPCRFEWFEYGGFILPFESDGDALETEDRERRNDGEGVAETESCEP